MQRLTHALCSLLLMFNSAWADSSAAREAQARAALAAAIADMSSRLARLDPNQPISYTATATDRDGHRHQQRYTVSLSQPHALPATPTTQKPVTENPDTGPNITWNPPVFARPNNFDISAASLVDENETSWVFRLPNAVTVGIDSADSARATAVAKDVNRQLHTRLRREIHVAKNQPRITSQRVYATQPFNPTLLARVDKFMLRIEYREAWPTGPWVHHVRTREMAGRYALFIALDEFEETTHTAFSLQADNATGT